MYSAILKFFHTSVVIAALSFNTFSQISLICPPSDRVSCPEDLSTSYKNFEDFVIAGGSALTDEFSKVDSVSFALISEVSDLKTCPQTITRTYIIGNNNGKEGTCEHLIFIDDIIPPTLIFSEQISECGNQPFYYDNIMQLRDSQRAVFADNCGWENLSIELVAETLIGLCPTEISRKYRLRDQCANFVESTEVSNIVDTRSPVVFSGIPDLYIAELVVPDPLSSFEGFRDQGGFVFDCTNFEMSWEKDSVDSDGVVIRFYKFMDTCGNFTRYSHRINLSKVVLPSFMPIGPFCQYSPAFHLPITSDNGITGTWNKDQINTDIPGSFPYIFTPDSGQNAVSTTLDILITPEVQISEEIKYLGNELSALINIEVAGGVSPYTLQFSNGMQFVSENNIQIKLETGDYYLTVIDANGCSAMKTISVELNNSITKIICPNNTDLECISEIEVHQPYFSLEQFLLGGGVLESNCSLDTNSFNLAFIDTIFKSNCLTFERTYSLSDSCGNLAQCTQFFSVNDDINPNLNCPSDIAVLGDSNIPERYKSFDSFLEAGGTLSDNCEINEASFELSSEFLDTFLTTDVLKRTYYISDKCGNEDFCLHKIFIEKATRVSSIFNEEVFNLQIFPNPNSGRFTIEVEGLSTSPFIVEIHNSIGEIADKSEEYFNNNKFQKVLDLSYFTPGIYFFKIIQGEKIYSKAVVIE